MGIVENTYAELKQQELKNNPYSCLHMADIDINPHQVEAFTFALSSLELGGAILADEVGLGKTIEAGLAIKYLLCSGKNKILLIMPSNLRKQWQVELEEKFDIDSLIVDSSNWEDYLEEVKSKQAVIIVSYHFASKRKTEFGKIAWDFCVFDEAHRLRNVYKNGSKMANSLYELTKGIPKILLTATPMQNTLLDIYGLVQFIDDRVFYSKQIFSERYLRGEDYNDLKACLEPVVQRTLRKEVAEYIQFSERKEMTIDFELSPMEIELYVMINNYLKKEILYALPNSHRTLITCQNFIFNNMSDKVPITKEQVRNILSNGKALCLFDNVNISSADHIRWMHSFTKAFPQNRFVFSAEEKFYQTYTLKELPDLGVECKPVYLEVFGKRQVREMVTKWGEGKDGFDANEMTQKIVTYCNNINFAMTPFNIAVFMTIWDNDRNFVPINEGKVMRTYLETVLDKFSIEGFQRSEYDYDVKQHFLGYLAYAMCKKDEYYFTVEEFDKIVDEYHNKKGFKKSQSKFDVIFFEKNILCINGDYVFFSNTSIMEYCLASYAVVDKSLYELMTAKENRVNFSHEISFYSGIVQDCSGLLNGLNDEITEIILKNMDLLDEIEKLSIDIEFPLDKTAFRKSITESRRSIEEVDEMEEIITTNS